METWRTLGLFKVTELEVGSGRTVPHNMITIMYLDCFSSSTASAPSAPGVVILEQKSQFATQEHFLPQKFFFGVVFNILSSETH